MKTIQNDPFIHFERSYSLSSFSFLKPIMNARTSQLPVCYSITELYLQVHKSSTLFLLESEAHTHTHTHIHTHMYIMCKILLLPIISLIFFGLYVSRPGSRNVSLNSDFIFSISQWILIIYAYGGRILLNDVTKEIRFDFSFFSFC